MNATEVEPKPKPTGEPKMSKHEAELIGQIWDELTRIHGRENSKNAKLLEIMINRLKRHINRPDGKTLKSVPCLIDEQDELRKMGPAKDDDRV